MTNPKQNAGEKEKPAENIEFGKRLKSLRQQRELTLDAASRLTRLADPKGDGISRVTMSRYENGDFSPGLRELRILSTSFRVPLSYLAYGDSEDPMNFMEPSIELVLEDKIAQVVLHMLAQYGLIDKKEANAEERFSPEYEQMLEQAKASD